MATNKQKEAAPAPSPAAQAWEAGDVVTARRLAAEALASGAGGTAADEARSIQSRAEVPSMAWWLAAGVAAAYAVLVLLSRSYA